MQGDENLLLWREMSAQKWVHVQNMRLNFHKASSRQRNGHENQLLFKLQNVLGQEREKEEASVRAHYENETGDDKSERDS